MVEPGTLDRVLGLSDSVTMGRTQTTAAVEQHFTTHNETECVDGNTKIVVVSTCNHCNGSWRGITGPRKVAHICHIPNMAISSCPERDSIDPETIRALMVATSKGKAHSELLNKQTPPSASTGAVSVGASGVSSGGASQGDSSQRKKKPRTIEDTLNSALTSKIDGLLARAHFVQGNIPDTLWNNAHLREAFRLPGESQPLHYEPPKPYKMAGEMNV